MLSVLDPEGLQKVLESHAARKIARKIFSVKGYFQRKFPLTSKKTSPILVPPRGRSEDEPPGRRAATEGGEVSTHTPGPWEAEQSVKGDRPDAWNVYGYDDSPYSKAGDLYLVADNLTKANARLIAAAPELL